jgi:hypothetical protein
MAAAYAERLEALVGPIDPASGNNTARNSARPANSIAAYLEVLVDPRE